MADLAARGGHGFGMAVRDVEEDTGRLQTRVNGAWTIRLVTDEEASPLELDDVTFLDSMETRISQHLILHLTTPTTNHGENFTKRQNFDKFCEKNTEKEIFAMVYNLGVVVDIILEVILWFKDSLRYQVIKMEADGGCGLGGATVSQPRQFLCVLEVSVLQLQPPLQRHYLTLTSN